jgi:hypothetical protein
LLTAYLSRCEDDPEFTLRKRYDVFHQAHYMFHDPQLRQIDCSCEDFLKRYLCKHSLAMMHKFNYSIPPPEATALPLGQKRGRGRPRKTGLAFSFE